MSKTTNIFHVAGNYIAEQHIDIHDNQQVVLGGLEDERVRGLGDASLQDGTDVPTGAPAALNDILPIPGERKYTEVRHYIEERKRFDEEFRAYVENHTRVALCKRLTEEFGWTVDQYALGRNINRNRK